MWNHSFIIWLLSCSYYYEYLQRRITMDNKASFHWHWISYNAKSNFVSQVIRNFIIGTSTWKLLNDPIKYNQKLKMRNYKISFINPSRVIVRTLSKRNWRCRILNSITYPISGLLYWWKSVVIFNPSRPVHFRKLSLNKR